MSHSLQYWPIFGPILTSLNPTHDDSYGAIEAFVQLNVINFYNNKRTNTILIFFTGGGEGNSLVLPPLLCLSHFTKLK